MTDYLEQMADRFLTIHEQRERELRNLVLFKTDNPTDDDIAEARTLMNSYYRLCGLSERNMYLANDERTANSSYTKKSEDRESRWCARLNDQFAKLYGLNLVYCGYYPRIGIKYEGGGFSQKVSTFFYN